MKFGVFLGQGPGKGQIVEAADADRVLLDERLRIVAVYARGRLIVDGSQPVATGWFEWKNHAALPRGPRR